MPRRRGKPRHRGPGSLHRSLAHSVRPITRAMASRGGALVLIGVTGSATARGLVVAQAQVDNVGADSVHAQSVHSDTPRPHGASARAAASSAAQSRVVDASVRAALAAHMRGTEIRVSRSATRPPTAAQQRTTKTAALPASRQTLMRGVAKTVAPATPQAIALSMLPGYGWSSDQFSCLDELWNSESGWQLEATNSMSGAYGIPQALPGEKMASAGPDWRTNPVTQITWGLDYIRASYGSPCSAWAFKQSNSWY
jgi:hypothetical protein